MNVEKFCTAFNIKIGSNKYLRDRTVCKSCYNKNRRKNNGLILNGFITSHQQPEVEKFMNNKNNVNNPSLSAYENHAYVVFGQETLAKFITC